MNDPQTPISDEENERNTLLLSLLADLVPNQGVTAELARRLAENAPEISALIEGYGKLINVVGIAVEYHDAQPPMTLHERLSSAYYEETNQDPSAL